ncbi:TIGR00730 family Rossman fold protein [Pontibacter sp. G13]|uniref:LOG family protein n=1 Tax=Pontibacter sp. G13 TaxID=3074898 RepID=UPI00288C0D52|nr:TIGR00730 family Rossman fold protein [Pontibacter sp. G13]WNJ20969.1 TIGR00730 family Rossman fold protein [Pontibacter sp. G13]
MQHICVFCGANSGGDPVYREVAQALGQVLADRSIELIYGAGNVGLMGIIADQVLASGGQVKGVIPNFLMQKEVGHTGIQELILTDTMHERKQIMADLSDGFIAMPGGMGTMDELCEILTWGQLGLHNKPIGILNVDGYFTPLLEFFDSMVEKKFLHPKNRAMVLSHTDPEELLNLMDQYQPPDVEKWLDRAGV